MVPNDELEVLTEDECRRLLAAGGVGRVAVTIAALPAIFPVNYAVVDGDVVFVTGEGTKLRAAVDEAVVAFEIDEIDPATKTGWSVLVVGVAAEVHDPDVLARVAAMGTLPWAPGDRHHVVRLGTELVTGRRILPHLAAPDRLPAAAP